MKYVLIALVVLLCPKGASAQQHHLLVDVATFPGLSVTYNYHKVKWLGVGGGVQGYLLFPTSNAPGTFAPAVYGDVRLNAWAGKRNQLFTSLDVGMNFYKQDKSYYNDSVDVYNVAHNNGFYMGLSLGYFRRMTKRGGGPYISVKMLTNWYRINSYSLLANEEDTKLISARGNFGLCIGFKF